MTVGSNCAIAIAIAKLSDWFKNLALVYQPIIEKENLIEFHFTPTHNTLLFGAAVREFLSIDEVDSLPSEIYWRVREAVSGEKGA